MINTFMNTTIMQLIKWCVALFLFTWLFAFYGCSSDEEQILSSDCDMLEFKFLSAENGKLPEDVVGKITGNEIALEVLSDADISSMVANFRTNGESVRVGNSVQASGKTANNFSKSVIYTVVAQDGTLKKYTVSVFRPDKRITGFYFARANIPGLTGNVDFKIDQEAKTITATILKWIDMPDADQFVPTFTVAKDMKVSVNGQGQESGVSSLSFKDELIYSVAYTGGGTAEEYKVKLMCPQVNATLPVMRFSVNLGTITSKTEYRQSKLEIAGNGISQGLWTYSDQEVEIRLRGNSTMGLPKKPFRVKFPEKISLLGMNHAKEKSWVLLANDADKTLLRNAVGLAVSRTLLQRDNPADYHDSKAVLFTVATQHVDVYVGDTYQGVYHLTDQVQSAPGRVTLDKPGKKVDTPEITGGYLMEIDGFADGEFSWFTTAKGMKVTLKYPDMEDDYTNQNDMKADARYNYILNYVQVTEDALFSKGYQDAVSGWRKYFDQSTLVDYYLISEFCGNPDAWWSTYIYKLRDSDSRKLFFGPVWDFDIAFDNDNRISNATNRLMLDAGHDPKMWMNRFFTDPALKSAVKARWNQMKTHMRANALGVVENDSKAIGRSREVNFSVWNISSQSLGHAKPGSASYEEALALLKNYIEKRYTYLDGVFNGW